MGGVRCAVLLLALAACSIAPIDYTGKACPCPDGWSCVMAACQRMPARDGGVIDGTDAAACTGTHDEDGDGRPDDCDVCPGDSDNGADSDGDGVGDACDPLPAQATEHLALFESFATDPASTWHRNGNWQHVGDDMVSVSGNSAIESFTMIDPVATGRSYLVTRVRIGTMYDPGTSSRYVSLVRQFDPATDNNVRCLVGIKTITTPPAFALRDTGGVNLANEVSYPFDVDMVERLVFEKNGTNYGCSNATLNVTGSTTVTANSEEIGLRTRSTSATYAWVMLITSDAP